MTSYCTQCGGLVDPGHRSCGQCGASTSSGVGTEKTLRPSDSLPAVLPYHITANRIVVMSVITNGLYLFYWFFLTWKQYRDHTGSSVFPVWHALTLFLPVYSLFRTHAHARTFGDMMRNANIPTAINPGGVVALVLLSWILGLVILELSGGLFGTVDLTVGDAITMTVLDLIAISLGIAVLLHIQSDLNEYWSATGAEAVTIAPIHPAEVIVIIIGAIFWLDTLALLFSSSYRMGYG